MRSLAGILLVAASCGTAAAARFVDEYAAALSRSVFSCPEKIWPSTPWHRYQFLIVDHLAREARLITGNAPRSEVTVIAYGSLPPTFASTGALYSRGNLHGRATIAVYRKRGSDTSLDALQTSVHEVFHFVGQAQLARASAPEGRGLQLPEDLELRYQRRMLLISLRDAIERGQGLSGAAYWWQQIKRSANALRFQGVDATEGTAEYAAIMAVLVAQAGCIAGKHIQASEAAKLVRSLWERRYQPMFESFDDVDSYALGGLAGLLLQLRGDEGWQSRVERGTPMLELLLAEVEPQVVPHDVVLRARMYAHHKKREDALTARIDAFNATLQSDRHAVIAVPITGYRGPFSPADGFVSVMRDGIREVFLLGTLARFALVKSNGTLELRGQDLVRAAGTPCGTGNQLLFPVPRDALPNTAGDRLSFSSEHASADSALFEGRQADRTQWLCLR